MGNPLDPAVQELIDRQKISDVIYRYSRAIDRKDFDLLDGIYWPDAQDDHIAYKGDVPGFKAWVAAFAENIVTSHFVGNILIEFQAADRAFVETYIIGFHDMPSENGREDFVAGGRYLDRFEKRDGEWRIAHREVTVDFQMRAAGSAVWDTGILKDLVNRGARKPQDPLYRLHPRGLKA